MTFPNLLKSLLSFLFIFFFHSSLLAQCEESFQKLWKLSDGNSFAVSHAAYSHTKDLLVCGATGNKGIIVRFSGVQNILWSHTYSIGSSSFFRRITPMMDGGVAAVGHSTEAAATPVVVLRTDAGGNVLWCKRFYDVSAVPGLVNNGLFVEGIVETPDGGVLIAGRKRYLRPDGAFNYRIAIFKLGAGGDVDWTREDTNGNDDEVFSLVVDNGVIAMVGTTAVAGDRYGFLQKMDPATGNVLLLKKYKLTIESSSFFRSIEKTATGYEIGAQSFSLSGRNYLQVKTDLSGVVTDVKGLPVFGPELIDQYYYPVPLNNGTSILWKDWYYTAPDAELAKINADGTPAWAFTFPQPHVQALYSVLPDDQNAVLAVGTSPEAAFPDGPLSLYLLKVKPDGTTDGCENTLQRFIFRSPLSFDVTDANWQTTSLDFQPPFSLQAPVQPVTLTGRDLCASNVCGIGELKILGDTIVCTPGAAKNYSISSNGNCSFSISWSVSANAGLHPLNDSTVALQFNQAGTVILTAQVQTSCSTYSVHQSIRYNPSTMDLSIGADKTICEGDTLKLSISNNFRNVMWNTGHNGPEISVVAPGSYIVKATNDSICFQQDTTVITMNPRPKLNIRDYTTICGEVPLILDPGSGFRSYLWQDGSTSQTFTATGLGAYSVTVADINNCAATDTANIYLRAQIPKDFLMFSDTAICYGPMIELFAKQAFAEYDWNSGLSDNSMLAVSNPGTYILKVTNAEGCVGADTVAVRDAKCLQVLYVPTAFTPNGDGKNDGFSAIAYAPLDDFELMLFNRWGERVFYSKKIHEKWPGIFKGNAQPSSAFVWTVKYKFFGEKEYHVQKGTLLLIR